MRRSRAFGRSHRLDDIRGIDAARAFLGMKNGIAAFADIDGVLNMD
jgi:hypothetical protein